MQTYKTNGFSPPFPWQQIVTWIFYILNLSLFYVFTIALFPSVFKEIVIVTFGLFSIIVFILALIATYRNPADELFIAEMRKKEEAKVEKRVYWLEISKNQSFCIICCSNINGSSKHCKKCNKCVEYFDHHCDWLNNCIGKANYSYFYFLLLILLIQLFYGTGICLYGFIKYIQWKNSFDKIDNDKDRYSLPSAAITMILAVSDLILGVNLTYLWLIHTWLKYKGITTYEYILMKIEARELNKKEKEKKVNRSEDNPLQQQQINNDNNDNNVQIQKNNFFAGNDLQQMQLKKKNKNKFTPNELIKVLDSIPQDKNLLKNKEEKIIIRDENAKENIFKPLVDKIYLNKQLSDYQNSIKNVKTNLD